MTRHSSGGWPSVEPSEQTPPTAAELAEAVATSLEWVQYCQDLLHAVAPSPQAGTMAPADATDMDSALSDAMRQLRNSSRIAALYGTVKIPVRK